MFDIVGPNYNYGPVDARWNCAEDGCQSFSGEGDAPMTCDDCGAPYL